MAAMNFPDVINYSVRNNLFSNFHDYHVRDNLNVYL